MGRGRREQRGTAQWRSQIQGQCIWNFPSNIVNQKGVSTVSWMRFLVKSGQHRQADITDVRRAMYLFRAFRTVILWLFVEGFPEYEGVSSRSSHLTRKISTSDMLVYENLDHFVGVNNRSVVDSTNTSMLLKAISFYRLSCTHALCGLCVVRSHTVLDHVRYFSWTSNYQALKNFHNNLRQKTVIVRFRLCGYILFLL